MVLIDPETLLGLIEQRQHFMDITDFQVRPRAKPSILELNALPRYVLMYVVIQDLHTFAKKDRRKAE